MRIACVGDCGIDHYVRSGERRVGGITANFALSARKRFDPADDILVVAPLGDDADAALVRDRFEDSGIRCEFVSVPGRTPVQHIEVDDAGERHFVGYEEGVLREYRIDRPVTSSLGGADLVMAPVFEQNLDMFRSLLAAPIRGELAVDFADFAERPDFRWLDECGERLTIGFFGLDESNRGTIERLRSKASALGKLFVVTLGAAGSLAFWRGAVYRCAAHPVDRVVDTTGAGDAFAAGFLSHYVKRRNVTPALAAGSESAAESIRAFGGN